MLRASTRTASRTAAKALRRFSTAAEAEAAGPARLHPAQADSLMAIGTRDIFDTDHDMFREMARKFWQDEVVPFHPEWEKAGEVPRELWTKAGELGLLSTMVPEVSGVLLRRLIRLPLPLPLRLLLRRRQAVTALAHAAPPALQPAPHSDAPPTAPQEYGGLGLDCKNAAIMWEEQVTRPHPLTVVRPLPLRWFTPSLGRHHVGGAGPPPPHSGSPPPHSGSPPPHSGSPPLRRHHVGGAVVLRLHRPRLRDALGHRRAVHHQLRHRGAEAPHPAQARLGRVDRRARHDGAVGRLRLCQHQDGGEAGRRRLGPQRLEGLHHQRLALRRRHRLRQDRPVQGRARRVALRGRGGHEGARRGWCRRGLPSSQWFVPLLTVVHPLLRRASRRGRSWPRWG